jgi:HPt (histidine-containing phosphotransfer) domain-containing protein
LKRAIFADLLTENRKIESNLMEPIIIENVLKNFIENELGSEAEFFYTLLKIFSGFLGELEAAKFDGTADNLEHLKNLAHKIKSSCQSYGAEALRNVLVELELAAKDQEKEKVRSLYDEVLQLSKPTLAEINRISAAILKGDRQSA